MNSLKRTVTRLAVMLLGKTRAYRLKQYFKTFVLREPYACRIDAPEAGEEITELTFILSGWNLAKKNRELKLDLSSILTNQSIMLS